MHILGKVFTWMVVLAAAAAVVLTGRMLDVRNNWMSKVDEQKQKGEANAREIAAQRTRLHDLRTDLAQTMLGWENYWTDVRTTVEGGGQSLRVDLGSNDGVGFPETPEPPTLHAFQPNGDGGYVYVGPFRATTVRENDAALTPAWQVRSNEPGRWQDSNWRFRAMIPAPAVARFSELQTQLTIADERLAERRRNLQIQEQLVGVSQEHLKFRREELLGSDNPPASPPDSPIEWEKGLVAALEIEEDDRNGELAELDRLRREVKRAFDRFRKVLADNHALVRSLPQPETQQPTAPAVSSR